MERLGKQRRLGRVHGAHVEGDVGSKAGEVVSKTPHVFSVAQDMAGVAGPFVVAVSAMENGYVMTLQKQLPDDRWSYEPGAPDDNNAHLCLLAPKIAVPDANLIRRCPFGNSLPPCIGTRREHDSCA